MREEQYTETCPDCDGERWVEEYAGGGDIYYPESAAHYKTVECPTCHATGEIVATCRLCGEIQDSPGLVCSVCREECPEDALEYLAEDYLEGGAA